MQNKNIFGEPLIACSLKPRTGFYRDGCCNSGAEDLGEHTVCIVATEAFLQFSKKMGNDLSTPVPQYSFDGVKPGDHWCLCAMRWMEAYKQNCAPKIVLAATNESLLKHVSMEVLISFAYYEEQKI